MGDNTGKTPATAQWLEANFSFSHLEGQAEDSTPYFEFTRRPKQRRVGIMDDLDSVFLTLCDYKNVNILDPHDLIDLGITIASVDSGTFKSTVSSHIVAASHDCERWVKELLGDHADEVDCIHLTGKALAYGMFYAIQKNHVKWTSTHEPLFNGLACILKGALGDKVHIVLQQGELFYDTRYKYREEGYRSDLLLDLRPSPPDTFKVLKHDPTIKTKRRTSSSSQAAQKKQKPEASTDEAQEEESSTEKLPAQENKTEKPPAQEIEANDSDNFEDDPCYVDT